MRRLALFALMTLGFGSFAYEPFTPNAGVTTGLGSDSCIAYEGDQFQKVPEIDFGSAECVGLGGWRVISHGGDSRSYVKLVNGKTSIDLQGQVEPIGQFPNVSTGIEWRVQRVQGKSVTPVAALVGVVGQDPDDFNKSNGQILVIKLGAKACIMDRVPYDGRDERAEKDALNKARVLADEKAPRYACK